MINKTLQLNVPLFEQQLIPRLCPGRLDSPDRKFQDRVGQQASRNPARHHGGPRLPHPLFPIDINHVDCELHPKAMYCLAGYDPQAFSGIEAPMLEKACPPLRSGIGNFDPVGDNSIPGLIAH